MGPADPYGASIEVRVAAIDLAARPKRIPVDLEDLRCVLNLVHAGYLAIDAARYRSSMGGFDRLLAVSRDISELDGIHEGGEDVTSAFDAYLELHAELAARGHCATADERRVLHALEESLASGAMPSVSSALKAAPERQRRRLPGLAS